VAAVHGALAARPGDWLLIFDNATSAAAIRSVLPPAGNGQVLITSRNAHWPVGQVLDVPVLDIEAAAAFLVNRTGATEQEAVELATELEQLSIPVDEDRLSCLRLGFLAGSLDELSVGEGGSGADEGDEVGRVDGAPAVLGGLDELEGHGQAGRP
jgi:hypothetical protein